jgi:transcriptional regulator with XRE-family HTH domain
MNDRGHDTGRVFANTRAIEGRLLELGWSRNRWANEAEVDPSTISRLMNGRGVSRENAALLAEALDGPVPEYFRPRPLDDPRRAFGLPLTEEWEVAECLADWVVASNGLRYVVCRMAHRFTPGRFGRGKLYNLHGVRGEERAARHELMRRHAVASAKVGVHPNAAENLSAVPTLDGNGWWVIDRWVEGVALDERLTRGPLTAGDLRPVATGLLRGLAALHAAGVVVRELAPARVIVPPGGSAVLTDFELAKLFDGSPSVSRDWPDDPYRAPEVEGGGFDRRADLYSWARVVTRAANCRGRVRMRSGSGEVPSRRASGRRSPPAWRSSPTSDPGRRTRSSGP